MPGAREAFFPRGCLLLVAFSSLALHCGPDFSASCTLTYRKVSFTSALVSFLRYFGMFAISVKRLTVMSQRGVGATGCDVPPLPEKPVWIIKSFPSFILSRLPPEVIMKKLLLPALLLVLCAVGQLERPGRLPEKSANMWCARRLGPTRYFGRTFAVTCVSLQRDLTKPGFFVV
ncbi:BQ5605_C014g07663 [Microbotryum silenes-dioicae]|uniref:BQ5605_C014g07663 protein n=1 Tax=Microbotryum silenes-dioicae TaxID=796604 RepID=A0A2X0LY55_9BASI|nr:BQ5605_C014g07663 [Microbotryum silenes-dioicae]